MTAPKSDKGMSKEIHLCLGADAQTRPSLSESLMEEKLCLFSGSCSKQWDNTERRDRRS